LGTATLHHLVADPDRECVHGRVSVGAVLVTDIKQRLSEHHGQDLKAAIEGGYDSDPIFTDAKAEIEHLTSALGVCKSELSRLEKLVFSLRAELDEWERGITRYVGNP
jgi:hypothetical protein